MDAGFRRGTGCIFRRGGVAILQYEWGTSITGRCGSRLTTPIVVQKRDDEPQNSGLDHILLCDQ
jgi:hypothetical protein